MTRPRAKREGNVLKKESYLRRWRWDSRYNSRRHLKNRPK